MLRKVLFIITLLLIMKKLFLIAIVFVTVLPELLAIHPVVRNFNRKLSNAGTQNWDIIQYKNDWMYFANNNGLLEFDGLKWSLYPIKNYTNVRSIYYDKESGRIYAGAFNEFGYYERNKSGILRYTSLLDKMRPEDKKFSEIWKIHKSGKTLYFQGDYEVFRYDENVIVKFRHNNKINSSAVIYNSFIVSDSEHGAMFLNGDLFIPFPNSDILKGKKICSIIAYGAGKILFVSEFNGLFLYDGNKVIPFKTDIDSFLSENQIFCATYKYPQLAIGTVRNGLVVKNMITNANVYSNTFTGLQNNTVLSMNFDRAGNLWLGLDKGIDYVMINSAVYDLFGNHNVNGAGYASLIDNNLLYLGTNQGLYVSTYPLSTSHSPFNVGLVPNIKGQVWSLKKIGDDIFCGSDKGTFVISKNKIEQIQGVAGTWNFKPLTKHPGYVLGCSYQGFFTMCKTPAGWKLASLLKGFDESGGMFEEDNDGRIWFSHWMKGVFRLTLNTTCDTIVNIEHFGAKNGFPSQQNNTLFRVKNQIVFSTQQGFFNYNDKKGKIEKSVFMEKLFGPSKHSKRLLETPTGDIWCFSLAQVMVALKQKNNAYKVDSVSFCTLKSKLISGFEHIGYINDSNMIVGTEDGFSWLNLKNLNAVGSKIKLTVSKVYSTNDRDSIVTGYVADIKGGIPEFNSEHNSIRFEFVGTEFKSENAITYSYMLENYDTEWSQYSPVNTKEYTRLAKGTYTFRIRAKNIFNAEITETSYKFTILPPWYQTTVAIVIYLILFVVILVLLLRYIKFHSEKGAREMEARKELEMKEQEKRFQADAKEKEKEIIGLKNQKLQYELRHKSQDLASSTMNLIRKNEMLLDINNNLDKISIEITEKPDSANIIRKIKKMQDDIKKNIEHDNNWKKFQENFDLVYENYLKRLGEQYPVLTVSDKKLCAYLKMDLSSKDIAPLLNMSFRSVEMSRYRLRKKLNLERDVNLTEFLQNF